VALRVALLDGQAEPIHLWPVLGRTELRDPLVGLVTVVLAQPWKASFISSFHVSTPSISPARSIVTMRSNSGRLTLVLKAKRSMSLKTSTTSQPLRSA